MTDTTTPAPKSDVELKPEWRCFHCDEVFTDRDEAREHFGYMEDGACEGPACKLSKDEKGLVGLLRAAWAELCAYREEDTALVREVYGLGSKHNTEKREWGDKEYAAGLAAGRAEKLSVPSAEGVGGEDADDAILRLVRKHFNEKDAKPLIRTVWKDSIDVDYPSHSLKAFLSAVEALRRVPASGGWQPMETAPKDGSLIILAADNYVNPGWWEKGQWNDSRDDEGPENDYLNQWGSDVTNKPTHWMPLPAPPPT